MPSPTLPSPGPAGAEPPAVGERIRDARQARGWTLADLAAASGLSISALSKIENAKSGASFDSVSRVAAALGLRFDDVLSPGGEAFAQGRRTVTRRGEGPGFANDAYAYRVHCHELARKAMIPLVMTIHARGTPRGEAWTSHPGEEVIHVLSGELELHTELYEPLRLSVGDTAYIDSRMRHAFTSIGEQAAVILSVCLADSLDALLPGARPQGQAAPPRPRGQGRSASRAGR